MKAMENFTKLLEEKNIKYDTHQLPDGNECVNIGLSGDNFSALHFLLIFDEEGLNTASVKCYNICKFPKEKNLIMLQTVNALNNKYRWVSFYVTAEGTISAGTDVRFTEDCAAEVLFEILSRMISIMETAYVIIMKAMYV